MTITTDAVPRRRNLSRTFVKFAIVWVTLGLFVVLAVTTPGFLNPLNLSNILHQQASILIVAAPYTLALIAGSFDVSVSAVYITAPLAGLQVLIATNSAPLAILASVGVGAVCGAVNALAVVIFHIDAVIATLATSFIYFGIGYVVSGQSIVASPDASFRDFAMTRLGGLTTATLFAILVVAIFWVLLTRTRYGRYVYATGANIEAARLSGVRTALIIASTFVLVGTAAGFAGILNAAQSLSAQASDDFSFVFSVTAAVVVGGTSIAGGSGSVWRTVVGAIFIAMLGNGFNLNQVDPIMQRVVLGAVILLAVGMDAFSRRRSTR
jgi:ribose transport system permease protein